MSMIGVAQDMELLSGAGVYRVGAGERAGAAGVHHLGRHHGPLAQRRRPHSFS